MQHRRLSCCGAMSVALFIHVPLFLSKLLSFEHPVAGVPISLVERKGFTYTLGRGFYSLTVPLSAFLNSQRNKTQNTVRSGSAPAWSLFLGWHWNSTFLFCFMHFSLPSKIYTRARNLFFFLSLPHSQSQFLWFPPSLLLYYSFFASFSTTTNTEN